jgi:hypothetical protein
MARPKTKAIKPSSREKVTCKACGGTFPAEAPVCMTCKWPIDDKPTIDDEVLCTLRRIARALDTMRYYMWDDRGGRS